MGGYWGAVGADSPVMGVRPLFGGFGEIAEVGREKEVRPLDVWRCSGGRWRKRGQTPEIETGSMSHSFLSTLVY